jgi:hypothetical protein|tara:strand:+ start:1061 stop:1312 length:252 start_codon:yes stop_codon:yes gene_type:complete
MNRDEILKQLREGVITVTFTKLNGDEREMDCTLNMNTIPKEAHPKTDGNVREGVDTTIGAIKCYDVNAKGWRSFLLTSVIKVV